MLWVGKLSQHKYTNRELPKKSASFFWAVRFPFTYDSLRFSGLKLETTTKP